MDVLNIVIQDSLKAAPLLCTVALSLVLLLVHSFLKRSEDAQFWIGIAGMAGTIAIAATTVCDRSTAFSGMIMTGGYANVTAILFLSAAILTFLFSRDYLIKEEIHFGEYYALIVIAVAGMMTMSSSRDLVAMFLGLEVMSVALYVLAGFIRRSKQSNEAALKYFLLGAFATGFLLYGIALIYGATGSTNFHAIVASPAASTSNTLFMLGCGLLLVGFAFKVAAVPFHMWAPDVYEGAPTSVSGFMSTAAKAAAVTAAALIFSVILKFSGTQFNLVIAIISAASMILGNVVAIAQTNIKRMLAYSSIAHAGYLLIGITAGSQASTEAILFYLASYILTNLGAFGIVALLESPAQTNLSIDDYHGLGTRKPALAVLMSIFLFSLAGIPPFSGFFAKYYLLYSAVQQGWTWLVIVAVITSVVSVYFYLRIVVVMYFKDATVFEAIPVSRINLAAHLLSAAGILLFGLLPSLLLNFLSLAF